MKVLIMRGIPGSGKSTYVNRNVVMGISKEVVVCSADHYHMEGNVYQFRKENVQKAHDACLKKFLDTVQKPTYFCEHFQKERDLQYVVVDNTNITTAEIAPYYRLAQVLGFSVQIIRVEVSPIVACRRNVHDVPAETVFRMYDALRTEKLPIYWWETVLVPEDKS